ncbi:PiggyBac transposable element-derived protein 4 [Anthophora quadrimaculata]
MIESEESSDGEVVSFRRNVTNRISSSSSEESYASEDLDDMLEELAINEEEELNSTTDSLDNIQWNEFANRQHSFSFTGIGGLLMDLPSNISASKVFSLFLDEKVISLLVTETNRYAEQKLHQRETAEHARLNRWKPTTSEEMIKFIGLMIWMGLVQTPLVKCWSTDPIYNFPLPRSKMPRNRFELLLTNLHFANNETMEEGSRLGKVLPLLNLLTDNYQKVFSPGEDIVVDETMVPWRGRLIFRQFIPTKSHKYGIKVFKLCSTEGYTWSAKVYSGRDTSGKKQVGIAENVCIELADKLINEGRTLFVDNFYTSYELAAKFLQFKTHVIGTVRYNKKFMPRFVMSYPLKRGQMIAREDDNGIVVLKWRDVRDVRILSTKHAPVMASNSDSTHRGRPPKQKPLAVLAYNNGKIGIDRSDQMVSYATTIRKSIKWYRKLALHLLLGTSIVNAHIVYQRATNKKIEIRKFRELLVTELLSPENAMPDNHRKKPRNMSHHLEIRKNQQGKPIRRMCALCYQKKRQTAERQEAKKNVKKTTTYCSSCPKSPQMCLECFNEHHAT